MGNNIKKLQKIIEKAKEQGKKIAFCHGCFDGLHDGHIKLFQKAKSKADIVIVGVERDEYVRTTKGSHRPFIGCKYRIEAYS